ncbi:MAG: tripartite tricarboxylate transporter substrate binding protein [Burkholderiaceae bacterium]|jgi:tripartite-type tricarboxylate transporter receptor subunit TctC|nr:tripartite tricarboxylate transporter substrate binding protein [Burkholderiales bacterium]MCZ8105206.1 tripartite tricarboxylate transporter substrate binding protein [Burkholderiales bacterium]MCZ8339841.1 tripartite tricarboxylate transporter substrate binding protein [Burkholderiaceae bacterium]
MRSALSVLCAAALAHAAPIAHAEEAWPAREVKMIAPFPAGSGATDTIARLMAERLRVAWNQPVVVQNLPGAAGSVGIGRLARSPADGYTLATSGDAAIVVNVSLYKSLAYDPVKDLVPIALIGRVPNLLVVHPANGPKTLPDLVATAKARPGAFSFTSNGYGTSQHMAIEQLKRQAGIEVVHAPKPGTAVQDVAGGHVDAAFMNMPVALAQVKAGTLRALAQTGRVRSPMAKDVPTVAELGLPGFEAVAWAGVFAPAGTPDAVVRRIAADVAKALEDPAFRGRLTELGVEVAEPGSPEQFAAFIRGEIPRVAELIRASGIRLE